MASSLKDVGFVDDGSYGWRVVGSVARPAAPPINIPHNGSSSSCWPGLMSRWIPCNLMMGQGYTWAQQERCNFAK